MDIGKAVMPDEEHLGHTCEEAELKIVCRAFGAFVYPRERCAGCPANLTANSGRAGAAVSPPALSCLTTTAE